MSFFRSLLTKTDPTPVGCTEKKNITKKTIENICFKGGGMKGLAFLGAYKALHELGVSQQIKRYIGSSAGAIFAGFCACKIDPDTLESYMKNTDFTKFRDSKWGVAGEGIRLIRSMGLYEGNYFSEWYGEFLQKVHGDRNITFKRLYNCLGTELVVTATELTERKLVYMSKETTPDLPIRLAVRRSMSIPVFYVPISASDRASASASDRASASASDRASASAEQVYVDGGCVNNFPLNYFDRLYKSGDSFDKTLGFNLIKDDKSPKISNLIQLVECLIDAEMDIISELRTHSDDHYRTVMIDPLGVQTTDFDLSKEKIQQLVDSGYKATMKFFEARECEN